MDECLWVPYGYMAMLFAITEDEVSHAYMLPVFLRDQLDAIPSGPRAKIIEYNRSYLEGAQAEPAYAAGLELFDKFVKEV